MSWSAEPFIGLDMHRGDWRSAEEHYLVLAGTSNGPVWIGPMNKIEARVHGVPQGEVDRLRALSSPESLRAIYGALKDEPRVRFKDGFTRVIDMPPQTDDWPDLPEESHA